MVSAEAQKQLQTLKAEEQRQTKITIKPIPQRKFGVSVSKADQQRVIQQRSLAEQRLRGIRREREQIKSSEGRRLELERARSRLIKQQESIKIAKKLARKKGLPASLERGAVRRELEKVQRQEALAKTKQLQIQEERIEVREAQRLEEVKEEATIKEKLEQKIKEKVEKTRFKKLLERNIAFGLFGDVVIDPLFEKVITPGVRKFKKISAKLTPPTPIVGITGIGGFGTKERTQFARDIEDILIPETKEEFAIDIATFGTGKALGVAGKVGGRIIEKTLGKKALAVTEKGVGVGAVGLLGSEIVDLGKDFAGAKDVEEGTRAFIKKAKSFSLFGVGLSKGLKSGDILLDIPEKVGRAKVPKEDVFDPRFFEGERFPERPPGTTAEQFRRRFLEPVLPGEKPGLARGFTATANKFASITEAGKGTSEVFGVFVAPKGSPTFLRVAKAGERPPTKLKDLFSFKDFLKTSEPTLARITAEAGVRLGTGVKPKTKIAPFSKAVLEDFGGGTLKQKKFAKVLADIPKEFKTPIGKKVRIDLGEPTAPRGAITIPLTKTEAEGIIPFGTKFVREKTDFFTEFEGRVVPIPEFKALRTKKSIKKAKKLGKEVLSEKDFKVFLEESSRAFSRDKALSPLNLFGASISGRGRVPSRRFGIPPTRRPPVSRRRLPSVISDPLIPSSRRRPSKDRRRITPPPSRIDVPPPPPTRRIDIPDPDRPPPPPRRTFEFDDDGFGGDDDTFFKPSRVRRKRKAPSRDFGWNAFARPIKTVGGKRQKLVKINRFPITKSRAMDIRDFTLDTSLGRTGRIRRAGRPPTKKRQFGNIPFGYSRTNTRKFRDFRVSKGLRIPLKFGKVIERSRFLLDTPQEVRKIGVRKRIKQLRRPTSSPKKRKKRGVSSRRGGDLGVPSLR